MSKLLILLLIFIGLGALILSSVKRFLQNLFSPPNNIKNKTKEKKYPNEEIIYKKEDVIIYKGDPTKNQKEKNIN